jgi:putative pyruvate formate lyase activating enzyme
MNPFEPAYLALHREGELARRAEAAIAELSSCRVCPRNCDVDRLADETAVCGNGRYARVASVAPHFGEENPLRGSKGSGTIFFAGCNLRCVFCQNYDISQGKAGRPVPPEELADMMLYLQVLGCHNINFVTPEHVVPQVLEALVIAVDNGLRLPLVYNTSAYDSMESLRLLDGVVDIYMPDFKLWDEALAHRYLKARDYPEAARQAIKEMQRQVGDLHMDEQGVAQRGVLLRHLVMPGLVDDTAVIMRFLADEVSTDLYLNLMAQYYPSHKVSQQKYPEINRRLISQEYREAYRAAQDAGLWRFDERPLRFWLG